jgi:hypothetical protein
MPLSRIPDEFSYPRMVGPFELSGGWWNQRPEDVGSAERHGSDVLHDRSAVRPEGELHDAHGAGFEPAFRREYYYLQDRSGRLLWVYYDVPAGQWLIQGVVE